MPHSDQDLQKFRSKLLGWFHRHQRDMPWRRTRDPYCIWLSEIMLQQTRVAAAIPYYERFLETFPSVRALAGAEEEDVLRLWAGLGYYSRARNLQRAAREIVERHGGEFPRDFAAALALPGIGNYTAAAILSIAHGAPHAVLDGNVARVIARLEAIRGDLREGSRWRALQTSAGRLLDISHAGDWNQAMMELGATVCTPRAPNCAVCPVAESCRARKLGLTETLPEKRRKRAPEKVHLAVAVFLDPAGKTILFPPAKAASRKKEERNSELSALFSRLWHFPAAAVRKDARTELRRHLQTVGGMQMISAAKLLPLPPLRHAVTYREITITAFVVRVKELPGARTGRVLPMNKLHSLAVSGLTRKIARAALAR
ncbi:MAG: A/G-specific adenine glycosylase [Acidobacteriia bacterium]|nr:A/G-specific adenine glycosylase [Terriglobia bacterium]